MTQTQHKIISTIIISAITFLGFEVLSAFLSVNQPQAFLEIALLIFAYHIFWIAFMFDLHLKSRGAVSVDSAKFQQLVVAAIVNRFKHVFTWQYVRHFLNGMILPVVLYWSTVVIIFLNPFANNIKQIVILGASGFLVFAYWHLKEHAISRFERNQKRMEYTSISKLVTAFLAYAAILGLSVYFAAPSLLVFYSILTVTYFLVYQALFAHDHHQVRVLITTLAASVLMGKLGILVYQNFGYQYFTAAIVLIAVYNVIWGFASHYVTRTLTAKLAVEYLLLAMVVVSMALASHPFSPQI